MVHPQCNTQWATSHYVHSIAFEDGDRSIDRSISRSQWTLLAPSMKGFQYPTVPLKTRRLYNKWQQKETKWKSLASQWAMGKYSYSLQGSQLGKTPSEFIDMPANYDAFEPQGMATDSCSSGLNGVRLSVYCTTLLLQDRTCWISHNSQELWSKSSWVETADR